MTKPVLNGKCPISLVIVNCLIISMASLANAKQPSWTLRDSDAVADAALASLDGTPKAAKVSHILELTDALVGAGNLPRAKLVIKEAIPFLDPPAVHRATGLRGSVIVRLVELGHRSDAETLIPSDCSPVARAMLLGKLGVGLAHTGQVKEALAVAKSIVSLSRQYNTADDESPSNAAASTEAIGAAFVEIGALKEAAELASEMPDDVNRARVLASTAGALCRLDNDGTEHAQQGRTMTDEATKLARQFVESMRWQYEKAYLIAFVAEAEAKCWGPARADSFVNKAIQSDLQDWTYDKLVSDLAEKKEGALAHALLPAPDPTDPRSLASAAARLLVLGDPQAALPLALQAKQLAPSDPHHLQRIISAKLTTLFTEIFENLNQLGKYDDAFEIVELIDSSSRHQYYRSIIESEIRHSDENAARRSIIKIIDALKAKKPGLDPIGNLFLFIKIFAAAGYSAEAQVSFKALQKAAADSPGQLEPWKLVEMQADLGDFRGALEAATSLAPVTQPPNPIQKETAKRRSIAEPKAYVLFIITLDMAMMGDIPTALQAEAALRAEVALRAATAIDDDTRDSFAMFCREALSSIAYAQAKAGDPRGAFAMVMRIAAPADRLLSLLNLAGSPVH